MLKIMNVKEFGQEITGKRVNFLIGSGASMPYIPTLIVEKETLRKSGYFEKEFFKKVFNTRKQMSFEDILESNFVKNNSKIIKQINENYYDLVISKGYLIKDTESVQYIEVFQQYKTFISNCLSIMNLHTKEIDKKVNVFTTNYDLFFEKSADDLLANSEPYIFNDGSNGLINRVFDIAKFNIRSFYHSNNTKKIYETQVPTINLYKLHGSLSWRKIDSKTIAMNYSQKSKTIDDLLIVRPTKNKFHETLMNLTYHNLLREYQNTLDFGPNVLIVFGFSFQDEHIVELTKRALKNPELMMYVFCYDEESYNNLFHEFNSFDNCKLIVSKKIKTAKQKNTYYLDSSEKIGFQQFNDFLKNTHKNEAL